MSNPFTVLSVEKTASKREILAHVTIAMREQTHDTKRVAEAQKELFDPTTRAVAEFRNFIDVSECLGTFIPESVDEQSTPEFEMLDYFDEKTTTPS